MRSDLHYTRDEVARLRADYDTLTSRTTGRVMDDLLTLHARVAALTEHADRMRDVLLALADACDEPRMPVAGGRSIRVIGALDRVLVDLDALPNGYRSWSDTARALRTLAGEASR